MLLRRLLVPLVTLLLAALVAAGCGGGSDDGGGSGDGDGGATNSETPAPLEPGGDFVICTDVPYPPAEFQEGSEFKGYEVEMMQEVAERLGTEAVFQKTGFDGIIGALQAGKCDAIVSSMNVTPEREEEVAFVEYMTIGQAVAVKPDAEGTIDSLADLAGQTVAVQVGTTLKALIEETNGTLEEDIKVQSFPDAGAAASALQTGKVDAFFADAPVVADYVNKSPDAFAIGGTQIDELPAGIALRKEDTELQEAVQTAIDDMYDDGTIEDIFAKWNVDEFLLQPDEEMPEEEQPADGGDETAEVPEEGAGADGEGSETTPEDGTATETTPDGGGTSGEDGSEDDSMDTGGNVTP